MSELKRTPDDLAGRIWWTAPSRREQAMLLDKAGSGVRPMPGIATRVNIRKAISLAIAKKGKRVD